MKTTLFAFLFFSWVILFHVSCTPKMSLDPSSSYTDPNAQNSLSQSEMTVEEAQKFLSQLRLEFATLEDTAAHFVFIPANNVEKLGSWQLKFVKSPMGKLEPGTSAGSYRYQPPTDFNGTTGFELILVNKNQQTRPVSGKIDVESVIESGNASHVEVTVSEDQTSVFSLNFTNPDNLVVASSFNNNQFIFNANDSLKSVTLIDPMSGKTLGQLTLSAGNRFTFAPSFNLNGRFVINYQISYYSNGNFVGNSSANIILNILPVDDAPTFNSTTFNALKNKVLTIDLNEITSDFDGFGLVFSVSDSVHGMANIEDNRFLKFTPETNHVSTTNSFASVNVKARGKNSNLEDTQNLKIMVLETNHAPILTFASTVFEKNEDQVFSIDFSATDADLDGLSFTVRNFDSRGRSVGNGDISHISGQNYRLTFTPSINFFGNATIEVEAFDGIARTKQQLQIQYMEVTDPLVISTTTYEMNENSNHQISLKDVVSVPDADAMLLFKDSPTVILETENYRNARMMGSIESTTKPAHGTITVSGEGSSRIINYSPNKPFHGSDSATLVLSDALDSDVKYHINLGYTVKPVQPNLSISKDIYSFTKDQIISKIIVSNVGGALDDCSVSPELPAGLNFQNSDCMISGLPTAISTLAQYTITGSNAAGSSNIKIKIEVVEPAPALSLSPDTITLTRDIEMTPAVFKNSGGPATSCSTAQPLPFGLDISTVDGTCQIKGMTSTALKETSFQINGTNATGTSSIMIKIQVLNPPQIGDIGSYTIISGTALNANPVNKGGAIKNCTATPSLPVGLSISSTSCSISGTPSSVLATTTYEIKASNEEGSSIGLFKLTVNPPDTTIVVDQVISNLSSVGLSNFLRVSDLGDATRFADERVPELSFEKNDTCFNQVSGSVIYMEGCPRGSYSGTRYYSNYKINKTYLKNDNSGRVLALRSRTDFIYFKYSSGWEPWARYGYQEIVEYDSSPVGENLKVIASHKCDHHTGFWIDCSGYFTSLIQNSDNTLTVLWAGNYGGPFFQIINVGSNGKLDQIPVSRMNDAGSKITDSNFSPNQLFRDKNGDYIFWEKAHRYSPTNENYRHIVKLSPQNKFLWKGIARDLWLDNFTESYVLPSGDLAFVGAPHQATLANAFKNGSTTYAAVLDTGAKLFLLKGDFDGNGRITAEDLQIANQASTNVDTYESEYKHSNTQIIGDLDFNGKFDSADTSILSDFLSSSSNGYMQGLDIVLKMDPKDLEF